MVGNTHLAWGILTLALACQGTAATKATLPLAALSEEPLTFEMAADESRELTWWLPDGFDRLTLPISGGVQFDWSNASAREMLQQRGSWDLKELPVIGARYGSRTMAVIVPWPQYASLVAAGKLGIRFRFPRDRNNATPCAIVACWTDNHPLGIAKVFREWRREGGELGGIPKVRSLVEKAKTLPVVEQLYGAAHFYLWGSSGFSRHDVDRRQWIPFAKAIQDARADSFGGRLRESFSKEDRQALAELASAEWPLKYLTISVAQAIDRSLGSAALAGIDRGELASVIEGNRASLVEGFGRLLRPVESWGDGLSVTLFDQLRAAGIDRAVLTLSDLYGETVRPDVTAHAKRLGFPIGPYDSYHSVHSPDALPDDTWSTAQFDRGAYTAGRVVKETGRQQGGFKGRGFHFSPQAAWPYVQDRVRRVQGQNQYSAWFVDCDATAECFDDYNPEHPANRVDDGNWRRKRLEWLETTQRLLVGSEGGSVLFADVIHFGHGVHTPYIGHLDRGFRDRESPHFLGRHWPPDSPEQSFKAVPLPASMNSPYFDQKLRIPLYQSVLGDEIVATHHWSFDSLKFSDVASTRALLEILYGVPPMYHINREMWPERRERILHHLSFWAPLHRIVAPAPLVDFEWLTEDKLVQRTHFQGLAGRVTVTVNFDRRPRAGLRGLSAKVSGIAHLEGQIYTAK